MVQRRLEEAMGDLLRRVISIVQEKFPPDEVALITTFAEQFYLNVSPEDILERDPLDVYGALIAHWHFIRQRAPHEAKVRIYNPQFEQHGWQSTHTAVDILCDHIPFLIESIRMLLAREGIDVHLIFINSALKVTRDDKGDITALHPSHQSNPGAQEISLFLEIDRQSGAEAIEALRIAIENVLEDVALSVSDWQAMTMRMKEVIAGLQSMKVLPERQVLHDEFAVFLQWIDDNHFTYLGYCYQSLVLKEGKYKWVLGKDSCLGFLRKEGENYFTPFHEMSELAQQLALSSKRPVLLGKTDRLSNIHRPAYTDFIVVKCFDENGNIIGQHQFVGLYTSAAYNRSPKYIPLLRMRVKSILNMAKVSEKSHEGKILFNIIETLPRDDFFHSTVDELYELVMGIFHLQERQRIRLFVRKDLFSRTFSCLVFVPKEKFNSRLREEMGAVLMHALGGYRVEFITRFSESTLARIHFVIWYKEEAVKAYTIQNLQEKLVSIARTWEDNFKDALLENFGEEEGNRLCQKYRSAFPAGYREDYNVRTAVYDIQHMEKLTEKDILEMSFYQPLDEPEGIVRFKLYNLESSIPLSDVIPTLECMGLRVISERPHEINPTEGPKIWINDFGMVASMDKPLDVEKVRDYFQDAFQRIWYKDAEADGFNRLVLSVNISWREVMMLRAYAKYLWQVGFTFSQAYIEDVLVGMPTITQDIVELFKVRFNPALSSEERSVKENTLRVKIDESLEEITNIDEDRIITKYVQIILATIRTNFYQKDEATQQYKNYLSFKFNCALIPELPLPYPLFEIFVYSPRVEGVHLRGAKVARGGIRWSDRREDFRTEVLGLMKAQQVKNAVIVPLGAKGGFVPKTMPLYASRDEVLAEGIACYKIFISALLDVTDNLVDNAVVPPLNVVRYDEDDPYLVVAADKGTATFSDIANVISQNYGFWLGDAFASGGSSGYDHKKMAITARGGWESVKRHFREIGIDTQKTDFLVVGIGDMAGDVFGNGMLLSEHIKLIGAFNHAHIFLDPNPSPALSFQERKRLFLLPRSTWEDYNPQCISQGGGVYSRSSKFIPLSPEVQAVLGTDKDKMIPSELIKAMLCAKIDLLWNGGIGTYVKASNEHNASVGDRTNDALRVNGADLRCRVVGEGGNLGFTQLGRVEYALGGGKLNTDAIDNSGGVDCSDHEVNIKILLNAVINSGDLTEKQRNLLLVQMTEEVAELVLEDNRSQIEALSVTQYRAEKNVQMHCRLLDFLEKNGNLDRSIEFIPSNEELIARQKNEQGLTRPEFSVLLAYVKTFLKKELLASEILEDPCIANNMRSAFPNVLIEKYEKEMQNHRLKRQIIATQICNSVINDMGLEFIHRLQDETGAPIPNIIRSYIAAREIFKAKRFREAVEALNFIVPADIQVKMLHELNRLIRRGTRWFLYHREGIFSVKNELDYFGEKIELVREGLRHTLLGTENEYLVEFTNELMAENVPEETALITAHMSAMFSALDIVDAACVNGLSVEKVTITYYAIGARLELGWFREQVKLHPVTSHWDALARAAIRDDLDHQQRELTVAVMLMNKEEPDVEKQIDVWMAHHSNAIGRWRHMIADLKSMPKLEFIMYSVALRELIELASISKREIMPQYQKIS